ncbi:putative repeat protein (TIGR02543 family) [Paenibacillus rhizosphaerae]|uniref:Putative repeat protein (TIGR02543 family) n=1 Tax=Paenibacillus rhizosphaerae TaxID=297318 RepID=A0A839TT62_9BACL|nr:S-layer homology domain-containing protein [Paenibacillus rhizosphaerae]MBB3129922.1 putative repeat protein (TIGR02543 family) [Paenibacillus rhizosphaerae]
MHRLKKLSLGAVLMFGLQQLYPMAAFAEIAVEPQEDPFVFYVSDNDYGEGYKLRVSSYNDQEDFLYEETSENPPNEPFVISINPYDNPWIPHVDLEDPHPITFRVETVKIGGSRGSEEGTSSEGSEGSGGSSGSDGGSTEPDNPAGENGTGAGEDGSTSGGEVGDSTTGGTGDGNEGTVGSNSGETGGIGGSESGETDTGDEGLGDPIPGNSGEPGDLPGIGFEWMSAKVQQEDSTGVAAVPGNENSDEIVDSADYTWRPVATVEGDIPVAPESVDDLRVLVASGNSLGISVGEGDEGFKYDENTHTVHYKVNLPKGGPYLVEATVDGDPYGSALVKPVTGVNRFPSKTLVEGHEIHTYFAVDADPLVPYTLEQLEGMDDSLDAADGQAVDFGGQTYNASKEVKLPFEFSFYGKKYGQVWVDINGGIYFDNYSTSGPEEYPDVDAPPALQAYVSGLRLNPNDPHSKILTKMIGEEGDRKYIVQWNNVYFYNADAPITFQAILFENGDVQYQYPNITIENREYDDGEASTIGIQAGQGLSQNYLLYSHRLSMIESNQAIRFSPVTVSDANPSDPGPRQYSVTYNDNGSSAGVVPVDEQAYGAGDNVTVQGNTGGLKKDGYDFAGWSQHSDGSGTLYKEGDTIPVGSENITLYAVWTPVTPPDHGGDNGNGGGDNGPGGDGGSGGGDNSPGGDGSSGGNGGSTGGGGNTGGSGGGSNNNGGSTGGSTAPTSSGSSTASAPAPVVVNGKSYDGVLQTTTATNNGQTSVTAVLEPSKLQAMLSQAGPGQSVTIPVMQAASTTTLGLTVESLRALETGASQLVIQTANGSYQIPVSEISTSRLARLFQASGDVTGMSVQIIIYRSDAAKAAQLEAASQKMGLQLVTAPVDFRIAASLQGQSLNISPYSTYVQHILPVPAASEGIVSTGVMLDENGAVHPVPTRLAGENGSRTAVVNSLSGGTFALVGYSTSFSDVSGHMQQVVQDLASRLILQGTGDGRFDPDRTVTRAEFAAILVRALGLAGGGQSSSYADVKAADWYSEAVTLAQKYGIVNGYSDGTFRPGHTITREEALVMFNRAGKLARLESGADQEGVSHALSVFADSEAVSGWAAQAVAEAVHNELLDGLRSQLQPKKEITRLETAEILQRLLEKSGLI